MRLRRAPDPLCRKQPLGTSANTQIFYAPLDSARVPGHDLASAPGIEEEPAPRLWDWRGLCEWEAGDPPEPTKVVPNPRTERPEDLDLGWLAAFMEIAFNRPPEVLDVRAGRLHLEVIVRDWSGYQAVRSGDARPAYAMRRAGYGHYRLVRYDAEPPDGDWEPWREWQGAKRGEQ